MEVKFYWNGNFFGTHYSMLVDGEEIGLGNDEREAKGRAVMFLMIQKNLDYTEKEISFEFGGRL